MIRRFTASCEGNAAIEFAFCAPVFLMLLLSIAEFGRLTYTYHDMVQAARVAARYAIVRGAASGTPATASQIASVTAAAASSGITAAEVSVAFSPNNQTGGQVTVTIAHPFGFLFGFMPAGPFTLTSHVSQLIVN